ncbi:MAG: flagellar motor protein MotB [Gemmatimonas sp.]
MAARGGKKIVIVKKKVAGGGGHHGGSWKVAYADFVTAMMAFFMVMWILGMDDKTKQAIEGYFANPVGYKKGFGSGSNPLSSGSVPSPIQKSPIRMMVRSAEQKAFEKLRQTILDKLAASDSLQKLNAVVDVQVTREGLRIELIESGRGDVYFPIGSSRMNAATMLTLQLVGAELSQITQSVVLEGHTDGAKFGADAAYTNWELSADRANAARRVLQSTGVAPERVVEVRGYADTKPRVPDDRLSPANRRISILLPFTDTPESAPNAQDMAAQKTDSMVSDISTPIKRNY